MLYNILLIVQIVVSVAMIALILMQHGKGADAGAAFGSGASGTVFGSGGAGNFLSRTTGILATVFFLNCIALAWMVAHRTTAPGSIMEAISSGAAPAQVESAAPVPAVSSEVPAAPGAEAAKAAEPTATQAEVPAAAPAPAATEVPAAAPAQAAPAAGTATEQKPN